MLLCAALLANGLARFVASGLSASLPHVVPREKVVTMNSVATASGAISAFVGANFMLVPRWLGGGGDHGAAAAHLHRPDSSGPGAGAVATVRPPGTRPGRHQARDPRLGGVRRGHRLAARGEDGRRAPDGGRSPVRVGRTPDGRRDQLPAGPAAGSPHERCRRRRVGHRPAVLRRYRSGGLFLQSADPDPWCAAGVATRRPTVRC